MDILVKNIYYARKNWNIKFIEETEIFSLLEKLKY